MYRLVTHVDRRTSAFISESQVDPNPEWEIRSEYNGHRELVFQDEHGLIQTEWFRDGAGRVFREDSTARGSTYFTYDTVGAVVWRQGPAFDQQVFADDAPGLQSWSATIRAPYAAGFDTDVPAAPGDPLPTPRRPFDGYLATTTVRDLDANGWPVGRTEFGHDGAWQRETIVRDPLGRIQQITNAEGARTLYDRNLDPRWLAPRRRVPDRRRRRPDGGVGGA